MPAKLYHLSARQAGEIPGWQPHLQRARRLGFSHASAAPIFAPRPGGLPFLTDDHETADPLLGTSGPADEAVSRLAEQCRQAGLALVLDIVLDRVAAEGATAGRLADIFVQQSSDVLDPRADLSAQAAASLRLADERAEARYCDWIVGHLIRLARAGATGFRLLGLQGLPVAVVAKLSARMRDRVAGSLFAWTPGLDRDRLQALTSMGLDGVFASTAWWDGRASWYVEEHQALRRVAPVIGVVGAPSADRRAEAYRRILRTAAVTCNGLFMPMGFEFQTRTADTPIDPRVEPVLADDIRAANELVDDVSRKGDWREMRTLTAATAPVTALVRLDANDCRLANNGLAVLINTDGMRAEPAPALTGPAAGLALTPAVPAATAPLEPNEVRIAFLTAAKPIAAKAEPLGEVARSARIAIERLTPSVDGGQFPAKRIVGRPITVEADIYADGHDILRADLLWRPDDDAHWRREPLTTVGNDRWRGGFTPDRVGRWQFTVEAWLDEYATLAHGIAAKRQAGMDIASELVEARALLHRLAGKTTPCAQGTLNKAESAFASGDPAKAVDVVTDTATRDAVEAAGERAFVAAHVPLALDVERPQAEFASWYELFPRSQSGDPARHGTLLDVLKALPRIRDMGFDVVYFTPIHPIGTTNRKGRNNALKAVPGDLGSPYAIGGKEGGHTAIHPALGTIDDFRHLQKATHEHGLELALDFAIQCSLDHPWLKQHPGWFRHRPDGTIKYAENPPKKYEDIVNVDFYAEAAVPSLWEALRDVVLYWVEEGVRIFRVDNPHTKPLPFWQWMIADIRARHPDVIFLSEAFTRPKMMYQLAKVGFSQSYTYFTWRNTKPELTEYLRELTTTEVAEFFRPHFFVNTPDINPVFLQTSGRAGFVIRAALAATLSGLWGIYSGFEVCEAAPLPGREEYLDSEKYEIRIRDFDAPGNIAGEIAMLNRIRRANPALHSHLGLTFYNADNGQVLVYGKALPSHDDVILVAVSLDPHQAQETGFEIPLWEWQLPDNASLNVEDLVTGRRFAWTGKQQRVRLDPTVLPFSIWRLSP
jgi:starch synthase (maltosyl-transferring)